MQSVFYGLRLFLIWYCSSIKKGTDSLILPVPFELREYTEGCILVGKNREVGKVLDSRIWVHRLKQKIVEAKSRGEAVWLTVK